MKANRKGTRSNKIGGTEAAMRDGKKRGTRRR
jgi:hypothetical protein